MVLKKRLKKIIKLFGSVGSKWFADVSRNSSSQADWSPRTLEVFGTALDSSTQSSAHTAFPASSAPAVARSIERPLAEGSLLAAAHVAAAAAGELSWSSTWAVGKQFRRCLCKVETSVTNFGRFGLGCIEAEFCWWTSQSAALFPISARVTQLFTTSDSVNVDNLFDRHF